MALYDYVTRLALSTIEFRKALKKVANTPTPEKQKFPIGTFIKLVSVFDDPKYDPEYGKIEYTYAHAYKDYDGTKHRDYSILRRYGPNEWSSSSWYKEDRLIEIIDPSLIKKFKKELSNMKKKGPLAEP